MPVAPQALGCKGVEDTGPFPKDLSPVGDLHVATRKCISTNCDGAAVSPDGGQVPVCLLSAHTYRRLTVWEAEGRGSASEFPSLPPRGHSAARPVENWGCGVDSPDTESGFVLIAVGLHPPGPPFPHL